MFSPYRARADIQAASSTTINFAASTRLASDPIRLWAQSGRLAGLTALPTALTISGTPGTRYVYASLAAPSGDAYSTTGPTGLLYQLASVLSWNRNVWSNIFRVYHPGDGTLSDPARLSAVTFVESASATLPDTHHVALGEFECAGGVITSIISYQNQVSITVSLLLPGQCRLVLVGGNLSLIPWNGNSLPINGSGRTVTGSITLAPAGLTPGTTYFVYATWSGAVIQLGVSTTTHATHTNGVEIKSGDATQTLVGMVRVVAGPAFADTAAQRFVLSWFNRRAVHGTNVFTGIRTTGSTTFVELNTEIRSEFLTWADEAVLGGSAGSAILSTTGNNILTGLGFDGTTPSAVVGGNSSSTQRGIGCGMSVAALLAEGYHYLTMLGAVQSGTGSWQIDDQTGTDKGGKCRTFVVVRG